MENFSTIGHVPAPAKSPLRRYLGAGFVVAIHVVAIYALANGLAVRIVKIVPHVLQAEVIAPVDQKKPDVAPPPKPALDQPKVDTVPVPEINIAQQASNQTIDLSPAQNAVSDSAVSSVSSTHTRPPYPVMSRRLGKEGTVRLKLTISPQGRVVDAQIVKSSGTDELDNAAAAWVMSHWRYKPAMQGGSAVTSTTLADVTFSLKNAR